MTALADVATADVTIRAIAAGGDGVGTLPDGRTVFVPRAAPGDVVRLRNVQWHARFARADIADIVAAGSDRVTPACPHYIHERCGSCQLMHLAPGAQRAAKARIVGDAFRRIAHLDIDDPPVAPSPDEWRYRSKVTFAVRDGVVGYHPVNQPDRVFDVVDCLITDAGLMEMHAVVRRERALLPRDAARLTLRRDRDDARHVLVSTTTGDAWTTAAALHRALAAAGVDAVVWWQPPDGQPRAMAGSPSPWPVTAFAQVHPAMGDAVRGRAIDALGPVTGRRVWDLYAGTGDTSTELARRGAVVESVERDARAVAYAETRGPAGVRRHAAAVDDVIERLGPADLVVTNPPRIGMTAAATGAVGRGSVTRIVYISCDPATLARDAARLTPRFALARVDAFDQFPQTAHVECVAVFERR